MLQEPGATAYIGSVGKDKYAQQLRDCVRADGVAEHYYEDDAPTGTCAVLILEGERSLCANLAAANNYKKTHYETPEIQAVVDAATHIYSAGFFFTVSPETIQATGAHCAEHNKVYAMNLSAPFITQFFTEHVLNAIPFVDIMFGNESEAEAFGEKMGWDKSVENVAKQIAKMDKTNIKRERICIITQGSMSTVVAHADGTVVEYAVPALSKEEIKDVNGAGDAFVGGFMASLIKGKSEKECVEAGHYAASCILKVSGCAVPAFKPIM
jgi:adenosine kinase